MKCLTCGSVLVGLEDRFLELVADLIKSDENREDTSFIARKLREMLMGELGRPDPLGSMTNPKIQERLEYLRGEVKAERISYEELGELQQLAPHIDPSDVDLLEAAGVPEFPDDED